VARFLQEQGYTHVAVLKGGWQAWVDGGHPVLPLGAASGGI
jgi:rhodanese-related sulfurtransferase